MPTISRFYGIIIYMNLQDHPPPQFHARYAEHKASISIDSGGIIVGSLPARAMRLIQEWQHIHQAELGENWTRFEAGLALLPIDPL